jgi:hypothetical protein
MSLDKNGGDIRTMTRHASATPKIKAGGAVVARGKIFTAAK